MVEAAFAGLDAAREEEEDPLPALLRTCLHRGSSDNCTACLVRFLEGGVASWKQRSIHPADPPAQTDEQREATAAFLRAHDSGGGPVPFLAEEDDGPGAPRHQAAWAA
eukprot:4507943-Alexandrium_andersonii.AAC.1